MRFHSQLYCMHSVQQFCVVFTAIIKFDVINKHLVLPPFPFHDLSFCEEDARGFYSLKFQVEDFTLFYAGSNETHTFKLCCFTDETYCTTALGSLVQSNRNFKSITSTKIKLIF